MPNESMTKKNTEYDYLMTRTYDICSRIGVKNLEIRICELVRDAYLMVPPTEKEVNEELEKRVEK